MTIPTTAKLVFKGVVFDVYQWQQKMFDGSYSTFERIKRHNTAEVIAIKDGKICIVKQSQPNEFDYYGLCGGRAETGEDPLETAKRELLEESGMVSEKWELFKVYRPTSKIDWDIYVYIAKDCKGVSVPKPDSGEQIELKEFTFDEFIDLVLTDQYHDYELVIDILKMKYNGTLETEFKNKLFS